jgi:hypothetical protein
VFRAFKTFDPLPNGALHFLPGGDVVDDEENALPIRKKAFFGKDGERHLNGTAPFFQAGGFPIFDPRTAPDALEKPAHPA